MPRLAQFLVGNPQLMAGLVLAYQQRHDLSDNAIMHELGITDYGLARLVLCRRPRLDALDADLAAIAEAAGCAPAPLWTLLQSVADVVEAADAASRHYPAAALQHLRQLSLV